MFFLHLSGCLSRSTKQQQLEFLIETSATVPSVNVRNSRMAAVPEDTNVFQRIPMCSYFWIDQNIVNVCILYIFGMHTYVKKE